MSVLYTQPIVLRLLPFCLYVVSVIAIFLRQSILVRNCLYKKGLAASLAARVCL